ncbi:MAG TPA: hypothetical protein VKB75_09980, partial [Jatrophihabitans sp.]|nr:hypothetical protein [Jatrophihabitans sp.]
MISTLIALTVTAIGTASSASAAPPPPSGLTCPPSNVWGNTGLPSADVLYQYTPSGQVVSTTPLTRDY